MIVLGRLSGSSNSVSREGSNWFCGRCGHACDGREGRPNLSRRLGPEPNDAALYRAYPMPIGEVETTFAAARLTTNHSNGNRTFGNDCESSNEGLRQSRRDMTESDRHFTNEDDVKSMDVDEMPGKELSTTEWHGCTQRTRTFAPI